MLACARIGAVHTVVFGGFSPESLRDRINDCQCKVLITADGGYRRGQVVPLKRNADKALEECPTVEHVLVVMRRRFWRRRRDVRRDEGRTRSLVASPQARSAQGVRARADGRRRPAVHPLHVGHDGQTERHRPHHRRLPDRRVCAPPSTCSTSRTKTCTGARPTSVGSPGHSYLVYGPLANGATCIDVRRRARLAGEGSLLADLRAVRRHDLLHRADRDPRVHEVGRARTSRSTTCRSCACSARSVSRSIRKRGCGITA